MNSEQRTVNSEQWLYAEGLFQSVCSRRLAVCACRCEVYTGQENTVEEVPQGDEILL